MKYFKFLLILTFMLGCGDPNPVVLIKTERGDITVELFIKEAPVTGANFLKYIEENRFEGSSFYRVVRMDNQPDDSIRIEVVQGGLYEDDHPAMLAPIEHESTAITGILHMAPGDSHK